MAFSHGSTAVVKLGTASAPTTPTDISAYVTSAKLPIKGDTAEVTTLGATAKSYIPGLLDATFSLEGKFDPTVDAQLAGIRGIAVAFEYGPQGSSTGSPKFTGTCILTQYEVDTAVDGEATWSAEFQVSGPVTRATY
ncbi:MAG: hypothetical protein IMW98_08390 [Firmicutes bacterium]|nr:hypothetical protein [Bacillota bacterium]MBE3590824.1 hypothetical protein [Bacillota bacterium]